jgi:hypothetical protein
MDIAVGMKAHSGWAALVALGVDGRDLIVADRRRIELVTATGEWARQPYHAAEGLPSARARAVVERGITDARRCAVKELRAASTRADAAGHRLVACAVLTGTPMPDWTVDEILAVHFRMHKAEGALYRDALVHAAKACGLRLVEVLEKSLADTATRTLKQAAPAAAQQIAALGKSVGPPWGQDQKEAALAALIALKTTA